MAKDVDYEALGRSYELTGGSIMNAVWRFASGAYALELCVVPRPYTLPSLCAVVH